MGYRALEAHAAHGVSVRHAVVGSGRLRLVGNDGLGGQEQSCNGSSVLQCGAGDLDRVIDASLHEVDVLTGSSVQALACWQGGNLVSNNARLQTSVVCDLLQRCGQGLADDLDAGSLIALEVIQGIQDGSSLQQGYATAGNDAFFHGSLCVLHPRCGACAP